MEKNDFSIKYASFLRKTGLRSFVTVTPEVNGEKVRKKLPKFRKTKIRMFITLTPGHSFLKQLAPVREPSPPITT